MACEYREEFEMMSFDGKTKLLDKDGNPIKCGCCKPLGIQCQFDKENALDGSDQFQSEHCPIYRSSKFAFDEWAKH